MLVVDIYLCIVYICLLCTDLINTQNIQAFDYCMENHISFKVETLEKFITTSSKEYDLIIYDLDKEVFAKGTPNLKESTTTAISVMKRMIVTHYSTSFFIILSSIQFVATHVAQAMVYLQQKGFHVREFFHFPHSKNEFYPTQDITKDINVINETH